MRGGLGGGGQGYFGGHFTFWDVKKRPGRLGRSVTRFRLSVRGQYKTTADNGCRKLC